LRFPAPRILAFKVFFPWFFAIHFYAPLSLIFSFCGLTDQLVGLGLMTGGKLSS
jgi:hypothetical protein